MTKDQDQERHAEWVRHNFDEPRPALTDLQAELDAIRARVEVGELDLAGALILAADAGKAQLRFLLPFIGMVEEVGEAAHAILKMIQGIRGSKLEHIEALRDALGDIELYRMDFASAMGWRVSEIDAETLAQVHERDWKRYPKNGRTE